MQLRPEPRFEARVPCRVRVRDTTYEGTVRNVSWSGLFVETGARTLPANEVWLELHPGTGQRSIRLRTRVVWKRSEARSTGAAEGVGLRIQNAPETYYDFLLSVAASP